MQSKSTTYAKTSSAAAQSVTWKKAVSPSSQQALAIPFSPPILARRYARIEIGADLLLKATKVDGIYNKDPQKHCDAVKYSTLSYDEVISQNLEVMDTAAFALARDSNLPLRIFDIEQPGVLLRILHGEEIGTLVKERNSKS